MSGMCCKRTMTSGGANNSNGSYLCEQCEKVKVTNVCSNIWGSWGGTNTGCASSQRTLYY